MKPIETMLSEHAAALARREAARAAFAEADADAIGLTIAIREAGGAGLPGPANYKIEWMRAAEKASAALFEGLLPEATPAQIEAARIRWKSTLSRLLATTS
jgi:hypothetical protein